MTSFVPYHYLFSSIVLFMKDFKLDFPSLGIPVCDVTLLVVRSQYVSSLIHLSKFEIVAWYTF